MASNLQIQSKRLSSASIDFSKPESMLLWSWDTLFPLDRGGNRRASFEYFLDKEYMKTCQMAYKV